MNNISNLQNKEENLLLLYSQKILYDKSKTIKYFLIILAILNFLLGIISRQLVEYKTIFLILIFSIAFISKYLQNTVNKLNNLASSTQELFDRKLFNFEIKSRHLLNNEISDILSTAQNLKSKYPKKYIDNIIHTGNDKPNGVKDWYTDIPSSLPLNKAILKCQKQNIFWDKTLIKSYKTLLILLSIFIAFIMIIFYWSQPLSNLVIAIFSSLSLFDILIKEFISINKFTSSNIKIETIINTIYDSNNIYTSKLKDLQSKIFERRNSGLNVPSILHKINTKKLHALYKREN
ncbi:S-4TM family putative pore-forming effector [Clostridium perfringens]|uniref:S-4TM family putative pore-forming effector n=1 Tax=Clostridium perfringens TaxID=1502 RepID=UPI00115AE641|nr:S-4TM family putative pore-forming effector [Clostridium perfringens]ELP5177932.1 hypothetical protein [Clostridium perfringens]ELP5181519.1 hypothetical protein [Clostridium perfringens]ELP5183472.1 hypothetical protein [Clostridium perfringens]MDM0666421.1 S-4TM family putative pore-forming effector [Clostridium perfringens]MDM0675301.1 S-4TM family putative pore-forming effector [Clostridium perfringens]